MKDGALQYIEQIYKLANEITHDVKSMNFGNVSAKAEGIMHIVKKMENTLNDIHGEGECNSTKQ